MPCLTPTRVRLTLADKGKIIEESKKSDFCRESICEKFGISKATVGQMLKSPFRSWKEYYQKKNIEESQFKQTDVTKIFPVNQLTLR